MCLLSLYVPPFSPFSSPFSISPFSNYRRRQRGRGYIMASCRNPQTEGTLHPFLLSYPVLFKNAFFLPDSICNCYFQFNYSCCTLNWFYVLLYTLHYWLSLSILLSLHFNLSHLHLRCPTLSPLPTLIYPTPHHLPIPFHSSYSLPRPYYFPPGPIQARSLSRDHQGCHTKIFRESSGDRHEHCAVTGDKKVGNQSSSLLWIHV